MGQVFYWIFNMSISASLVGIIVLLLRRITAVPHRFSVLLWVFPALRFVLPLGPGSKYSIMTLVSEVFSRAVSVEIPIEVRSEMWKLYSMNFIAGAKSYSPFILKSVLLDRIFTVSAVVWLSVSGVIVATFAYFYAATLRSTKKSRHVRDNIYLCESVDAPLLVGIVKPKIIIPKLYSKDELEIIAVHENTHAKRLDNLWRLLGLLTASVHWFNPLAWLFLKLYLCDTELACDEAVVSEIGEEKRKQYAGVLLDVASGGSIFMSAFGGAGIKRRILGILSYRRISLFSAAFMLAFVLLVGAVLMTNAI